MKNEEMIQGMREHLRAGDHVSIDISHPAAGDTLVASLKEKMEDASSTVSISRVPEKLMRLKMRDYVPGNVSIGPFHRGRPTLKPMDDHKWRYLFALLNRNSDLDSSLDNCVKALRELEHRTRRCYSETITLSSNDFVEMLLLDAGFIIELFIKYSNRSLRRRGDPIFSTPGKLFDLRCDLILIENQIPLFVIKRLFQIAPLPKQCTQSLPDLAYRFFKNMIPGDPPNLKEKFSEEAHHLLDLVHNCLLPLTYPRDPHPPEGSSSDSEEGRLKSVTEMKRSGIRFQRADSSGTLVDITFANGIIRVPKFAVNESTERLLRNLVALEQCHCVQTPCVSSYAHLMSGLLCSEKDEKALQKRGIIVNSLDGEVKLSGLFRELCAELEVEDFCYYRGLCNQVKEYCEKKRRNWRRRPKRRHKIGWKVFLRSGSGRGLIIVLAVIILVLSFVGTLFSVLSFFLHHG